jgi:hypothetical protein
MNEQPFDFILYGQLMLVVAFLQYVFFPPDDML